MQEDLRIRLVDLMTKITSQVDQELPHSSIAPQRQHRAGDRLLVYQNSFPEGTTDYTSFIPEDSEDKMDISPMSTSVQSSPSTFGTSSSEDTTSFDACPWESRSHNPKETRNIAASNPGVLNCFNISPESCEYCKFLGLNCEIICPGRRVY